MSQRKDTIIEIAEECQTLGCGPDASDYQLFETIEECIGYRLTDVQQRLALVAFNENAETAKKSVWYTW